MRNEIGMTFAAALKAFLRQDPNIIMVGEIRDLETGGIAIKAALTGHLVLSTLHTNSAPETVTRLLDMGLEPFNVASALNLVLAQRLRAPDLHELQDAVPAGRRRARRREGEARRRRCASCGSPRRRCRSQGRATQGGGAVPREPLARHHGRRAAVLQGQRVRPVHRHRAARAGRVSTRSCS